jgi:hypothetical protein
MARSGTPRRLESIAYAEVSDDKHFRGVHHVDGEVRQRQLVIIQEPWRKRWQAVLVCCDWSVINFGSSFPSWALAHVEPSGVSLRAEGKDSKEAGKLQLTELWDRCVGAGDVGGGSRQR